MNTDCNKLSGRMRDICNGTALVDGKPISVEVREFYVSQWREQGLIKEWDYSQPSRGIGDVVAKVIHWTGIDKLFGKTSVTSTGAPAPCTPCGGRAATLNQIIPFEGLK